MGIDVLGIDILGIDIVALPPSFIGNQTYHGANMFLPY